MPSDPIRQSTAPRECGECGRNGEDFPTCPRHAAVCPTKGRLTLHCAMSGERETLTVRTAGLFGVTFAYGEDASVIVRGDDLARVRDLIDQQLANWRQHNAG